MSTAKVTSLASSILLDAAESALRASKSDRAQELVEQALAQAQSSDDPSLLARASALRARVLFVRNDAAQGLAQSLEAITLCERVGDDISLAKVQETTARILLSVGDSEAALGYALASLGSAERCTDASAMIAALRGLSNVYTDLRQWDSALAFAQRYLETAEAMGDEALQCAALDTLTYVHGCHSQEAQERGDLLLARACAEKALPFSRRAVLLSRRSGNRLAEGTCIANLAAVLGVLDRHQEGLDVLDSWQADPVGDPPSSIAHHLQERAGLLFGLGQKHEAIALLTRTIADTPTKPYELSACRMLAQLLEEIGDLGGALAYQKRMYVLVTALSSESARRSASVAAVRLETAEAHAKALRLTVDAAELRQSNEQLSRRSEDFERQALEDPLTGLPNRRRLNEVLATTQTAHTIVMIDIDHFKQVNDRHSHAVGDAVLKSLAGLLRNNCREGDLPVRWGGEEFAMLLRDVSVGIALRFAERTRASVQAYDWSGVSPGLAITASLGVAMSAEAATTSQLFELADRRLYDAKHAGRNRVVGPPVPAPPAA